MGHTLLVKDRPYLIDFYLPKDWTNVFNPGTELHIQLTLTPYEHVAKTKYRENLSEVIIRGILGLYRYTAIFPQGEWRALCVYDMVALQQEALGLVAERHDVELVYSGPVVKHRVRSHHHIRVSDELPILDQYYDMSVFTNWRLGIETNGSGDPLFIPFMTHR